MPVMPMLVKEDVTYLLENTTFDEYDIREWFREFIKVSTCPKAMVLSSSRESVSWKESFSHEWQKDKRTDKYISRAPVGTNS